MNTAQLFPIEPAHFDFDPERDEAWPLPQERAWDSAQKPSLWARFDAWLSAIEEPFVGNGID